MYRNKKGQFISKCQHAKNKRSEQFAGQLMFFITLNAMLFAVSLGVFTYPDTFTVYPHRVEAADDPAFCDLHFVECENEEPAQEAIDAISEALGRDVTDETKRRVKYLYGKATEADVPFKDAVKTIYCESMWVSQKSILPEESYGLSQIHLPSHKNVTKEQAMDAYFAIDFLVENWLDTKWYGYDRMTGHCANGLTIEL